SLLINLYKIKKQHEKEERIYKETIQIFPQLQYPDLNTCPDYAQSLKYQFHLSYLLGEALLKAYNTWYKCGGFLLSKNIKKANKDYQSFQEIFKQFDIFNSSLLLGFIENKALFLKEFSRIKKLLKTHQDYKAILDNIFNNFNYVLENFDLIEAWLLSDDFKQRYKEQNHPYPSLLNPQQLNDKNEKINYHNISAELAWQMNLPLPDNYEFVWLAAHAMGCAAFRIFLQRCGINTQWSGFIHGAQRYYLNYNLLISNLDSYNILEIGEYVTFVDKDEEVKFFSTFSKNKKVLISYKDPLSMIRTILNANIVALNPCSKVINCSHLVENMNDLLKSYSRKYNKNNINEFDPYVLQWQMLIQESLLQYFRCCETYFLNMDDIKPQVCFSTLEKLAVYFGFNKPEISDQEFYKEKKSLATSYLLYFFPIVIRFDKCEIELNAKELTSKKDISKLLFEDVVVIDGHKICIHIDNIENLDQKILASMKKDISKVIEMLEEFIKTNKPLKEEDILNYLKHEKERRRIYREIIDFNLKTIKQHRPDIVASWKYYQEFEKM
ncbi:DUF2972 domain-containing protein, partial [Campylobacter jejuni]|nr:DUF2972 domain-containing protein [Campylobacter jejuni]